MIRFDFDAQTLAGLASSGTALSPVPVLLSIAGVDLLSANSVADGATVAQGLAMPLPEIALWGLVALRHVARDGLSACELNEHGGALLIALRGEQLVVHSMFREKTVQVPYARLWHQWNDFNDRVRHALVQTFGPLERHGWWNPSLDTWLHGEWPPNTEAATAASMSYLSGRSDLFDRIDAIDV